MKNSIRQAVDLAQGLITNGDAVPTFDRIATAVREFKRIEFDVPDHEEADGFLFQFGEVNWFAEQTFVVNFTRQFDLNEADSEDGDFLQVQFEYRYHLDADLSNLTSYSSWWFPGDEESFEAWFDRTLINAVWQTLEGKGPQEFLISQDFV